MNVAIGDGSVRFISDTINVGTGNAFLDSEGKPGIEASGPSPFGVWGEFGSIADTKPVEIK